MGLFDENIVTKEYLIDHLGFKPHYYQKECYWKGLRGPIYSRASVPAFQYDFYYYINKNELTVSMLEFRSEIWTTTTHYIKDILELEVTLKKYGL